MTIANAKSLPSYKSLLLLEHTDKIFHQNQRTTVVLKSIRLKKSFVKIWNSTCRTLRTIQILRDG